MRPLSVFGTLSVLLLFASTIDARKDLEEYWRIIMKGQPMPESVQDLLAVDPATSTTDENADQKSNPLIFSDNVQPSQVKSFSKNFNTRPNLLYYNSYHNSHNDPPSEMNFNSITNFPQHDPDNSHNNQPSEVRSFSKNFNTRPNLLYYNSYHNSHNDPPSKMNFNSIPNIPQHDPDNSHNNQPSEVRSFSKNFNTRPNPLLYPSYHNSHYNYHNSHDDQPFEVKSFDKDVLKPDK